MAEAKHIRKVVGIEVALTLEEASALVNVAERLGSIIDANDDASPSEPLDWEAVVDQLLGDAERDEAQAFFNVSKAVGPLIQYTPNGRDE